MQFGSFYLAYMTNSSYASCRIGQFENIYYLSKTVTDSGFPRGTANTQKLDTSQLFGQILLKTAWKWRQLDCRSVQNLAVRPKFDYVDPPLYRYVDGRKPFGWLIVRDVCDWDISRTWHPEHVETVSLHCVAHLAGILAARNSLQTLRLNLNENSQKGPWQDMCTGNKYSGLVTSYFPWLFPTAHMGDSWWLTVTCPILIYHIIMFSLK